MSTRTAAPCSSRSTSSRSTLGSRSSAGSRPRSASRSTRSRRDPGSRSTSSRARRRAASTSDRPSSRPQTVSVTGPASIVDQVAGVQANVAIDATGLDIDQDVELIPVDNVGDRLTPVDVEPTTAHVTIAVFKQTESRPLPVTPVLSGAPAAGYEVTGIAVSPQIVSIEGDADAILGLDRGADGRGPDQRRDPGRDPGGGPRAAGGRPAGRRPGREGHRDRLDPAGRRQPQLRRRDHPVRRPGRARLPPLDEPRDRARRRVRSRTSTASTRPTFTLLAQVGGLGPGTHEVTLTATLPAGLTLVSVDPPTVTVTVTPSASAAPAASPAP